MQVQSDPSRPLLARRRQRYAETHPRNVLGDDIASVAQVSIITHVLKRTCISWLRHSALQLMAIIKFDVGWNHLALHNDVVVIIPYYYDYFYFPNGWDARNFGGAWWDSLSEYLFLIFVDILHKEIMHSFSRAHTDLDSVNSGRFNNLVTWSTSLYWYHIPAKYRLASNVKFEVCGRKSCHEKCFV